jgi:hypothetical protein
MKLPFTIYNLRFAIWEKSGRAVSPLTAGGAHGVTRPTASNRQSSILNHKSRRGVALVLTLILLSVTLLMALAFMAISTRERGSVTTSTDAATARLAADAALAGAEAQIAANLLAGGNNVFRQSVPNPYNFGLLVSTNYINYNGFNSSVAGYNPTNVNYYDSTGTFLAGNNFLQNLENLFYAPRPPVFIPTNSSGAVDFRYYLDLNRNGRFDANGVVTNFDNLGNVIFDNSGHAVVNFQTGDPEWIGVLEHPDQPYGPNNKFIARFAFIAMPVGNSLDLNAIHNQVFDENNLFTPTINPPPVGDGFFRNQGVGPWEINLAAFLADLNTNEWGQVIGNSANGNINYYYYQSPSGNRGFAFDDARALLAYRYTNNYLSLASVDNLFGGPFSPGDTAFRNDNIDGYSDGPLQVTMNTNEFDNPALPWAGADNTKRFFTPDELFDPNKTAVGVALAQIAANNDFTNRLLAAGTGGSTYDRYTFYRLLSQLGTDSDLESGKMNLNYDNLVQTNFFSGAISETNFLNWQPLAFFTNAADRMLRAYTAEWFKTAPSNYLATYYGLHIQYTYINSSGVIFTNDPSGAGLINRLGTPNVLGLTSDGIPAFGITNVPVYVNGRFVYAPAVNRLLQLAANVYDATTNNLGVNGNRYDYPSVFRPLFSRDQNGFGTNIFITGYTNVTSFGGPDDLQFTLPIDVSDLAQTNGRVVNLPVNVYGVPWIVGAKKGFPNFNELAMDTAFQITRKLEVTRPTTNSLANTYSYYQMFILNITNQVGVECWNSYANAYTNGVMIYVYDNLESIVLTNDEGYSANLSIPLASADPVGIWPGYNVYQPTLSFQIPLYAAVMTISNSIYKFNQPGPPYLTPDLGEIYETNVTGYPQPHWWLTVNNNLRVFMVDTNVVPNRIIDYVELSGPNSSRDLSTEIMTNYDVNINPDGSRSQGTHGNNLWATNFQNGVPAGLANQLDVSKGNYSPDVANGGPWPQISPADIAQEQENGVDGFLAFFHLGSKYNNIGSQQAIAAAYMTNAMQAPFTPTATVVQHVSWQANDPLVHYLATDLNWSSAIKYDRNVTALTDFSDGDNLGIVNTRYAPWGKLMSAGTDQVDQNTENLAYKDPLVASSDNWDFPRYKMPTAGWLGRVHRGTPWQTVYLKSTNILAWVQNNTGPITWRDWTGNYNSFDAANAGPVQDWLLFDLFTTSFNDNATRGTLSVNIPPPNLAAWSALFSGVVLPPNNSTNSYTFINPAGPAGVNSALGELVANINYTRNNFTNADGLVGAFEHEGDILATPQLTDHSPFLDPAQVSYNNDEMYEWLPQQVMSLLRVGTPRYVIYSYGQALKPAANGIYLNALPAGMFGMVTNYQVVSESATRVVMRIEGAPTNTHAVIESFNLLPPD